MNIVNGWKQIFSREWLSENYPWLLIVMTFAFLSRKALFNAPILIMALGGCWLLYKRKDVIRSLPAFRYMILFFMCLWLPMVLALPDAVSSRAFGSAARFIAYPLMAAFVIFHLSKTARFQQAVYYGVCAVLIFFCVDALVQYLVGFNFFGFPYNGHHVNGMAYPHLGLGLVLAPMSPLLFEFVRRHAIRYKLVWLVLPLIIMVVILSSSRTAWFMLAVSMFIFAIYMLRFYQWKTILKLSVIAIVLLSVLGYVAYNTNQIRPRIDRTLLLFQGDYESIDEASSRRLSLWRTAWNIGSRNLTNGIGVRGFRKVYAQYAEKDDFWTNLPEFSKTGGTQTHPHQTGLEIFAETGLPGVIGLLLFWFLIFKVLRNIRPECAQDVVPWLIVLMVAVNPLNVHMAFYGSIWSTVVMMAMITGLAIASGKFKSDAK